MNTRDAAHGLRAETGFLSSRRDVLGLLAASASPGLWPIRAQAQAQWPTRALTVIVPFAPGGAGNGSVRILAEQISPRIGQPMVVDNRPGAGGITGTTMVASSSDDHLLLLGSTTMTILPALRSDLGYDVQQDLQPVGMISTQPLVFAVGDAAEAAKAAGMQVVSLTGKDGGRLAALSDVEIRVPHFGFADRIQEVHIKAIHIMIMLIEQLTKQAA